MRRCLILLFLAGLCISSPAATLQYLSVDELVAQSTDIIRGTVVSSHTTLRGSVVYTLYTLHLTETWKGDAAGQIDIAVPGGTASGVRQSFAGAPELAPNSDYLVFLWKSRSGLNLIMGLSQGLFLIYLNDGTAQVAQTASSEVMLNAAGQPASAIPVKMRLSEMHTRVRRVTGVR